MLIFLSKSFSYFLKSSTYLSYLINLSKLLSLNNPLYSLKYSLYPLYLPLYFSQSSFYISKHPPLSPPQIFHLIFNLFYISYIILPYSYFKQINFLLNLSPFLLNLSLHYFKTYSIFITNTFIFI